MRISKVDVICIGFRSEAHYPHFLAALRGQTGVDLQLHLIEQGGPAPVLGEEPFAYSVRTGDNIGYAGGNDYGFKLSRPDADVVVFMNPDCFLLGGDFLARAAEILREEATLGAFQPVLLRYDFAWHAPAGDYDSLGIVRNFYGRWSDAGQGQAVATPHPVPARVDAVCGACIVARRTALAELSQRDGFVFNPAFFMYKEDIDFSLRLVSLGYRLAVRPDLTAHHCRGWRSRREVDWRLRYLSARNELRINRRWPLPLLFSLLKWVFVTVVERPFSGKKPAR